MELIILGHIIGDFYVQTDKIAEKKKNSIKHMILHCLIYSIIVGICFFILNQSLGNTFVISIVILNTHFLVDYIKMKCVKKFSKYGYMLFVVDQMIHAIILFFIFYMEEKNFCNQIGGYIVNGLDAKTCITIAVAILICWKPSAILISLVFKVIPKTVEQADKETADESGMGTEGIRIGSWIGILEREIILILGLMGQYSAIGFVLTAKSLARFKQLENKSFAEKYLVGTLLSSLIAIMCIVMCNFSRLM